MNLIKALDMQTDNIYLWRGLYFFILEIFDHEQNDHFILVKTITFDGNIYVFHFLPNEMLEKLS
jgi:hypothetical protein